MFKGFVLYFLSLVLLFIPIWQEDLGWLTPLALAVLLFGSVILWRLEGNSFQDLGYRRTDHWVRFLFFGFVIGGIIPVFVLFIFWAGGWADVSVEVSALPVILSGVILAVIRTALIAGSEELIFRGFFLQSMKLRYGFLSAAIGSAILWSPTHLPDMYSSGLPIPSILIGMMTFILWGIVLAMCVRIGENSLWLPFGLHFGYNLVFSIIGFFLATLVEGPEWILGHPAWRPESGVIGLILWIVGILILIVLMIKSDGNMFASQKSNLN